MEHPNAASMREAVAEFMAGDIPSMLERFSEDVVWYAPGVSPLAGTFRGRDGVARFLTLAKEGSGGSIRVELDDALASDRYLTIFLNISAERSDERLNVVVAQFFETDENGKWSRCWFLPDKVDQWNRFFAGASLSS